MLADAVLAKCGDREGLRQVLTKLMDYPKRSVPYKRGGVPFLRSSCVLVSFHATATFQIRE